MSAETEGQGVMEQLVSSSLEPSWLREMREQARKLYETLPPPVFDKSDLGKRQIGSFLPTVRSAHCPDDGHGALSAQLPTDAPGKIVYANRQIVLHHLVPDLVYQGVVFADLALALRMFPNLVQPYLGQVVPASSNKWVAMQSALWNVGLFLYVPKNVKVEIPLQSWWHRTAGGGQLHPRVLVVAEENSEVTLLLGETSRLAEDAFAVLVGEVVAQRGARVKIASVQDHDARMTRLTWVQAHVGRDAQVEWTSAELGKGWHIADVNGCLQAEGGSLTLDAFALGAGAQHYDLTLRAQHIGRHTRSRMRVRGLLTDTARTISRAVSQIEKGAVGTSSTQEERLLLLSGKSQAFPIPMLLIAEEDVSCDHAVSVAQLPTDHLFYLMARGLPEGAAKRLLLGSFLAPLYDGLLDGALAAWVEREVPL